jgi:ABC-type oligopeptide transport system ATPase subunit
MPEKRTPQSDNLIEARSLTKHFPVKGGVLQRTQAWVKAVENVSFTIRREAGLVAVGAKSLAVGCCD